MKPFDPAFLPYLRPARRPLVGVLAGGLLVGLLTIVQAFALGILLVQVVAAAFAEAPGVAQSASWQRAALWFAGLVAARALITWVVDLCAVRAAVAVSVSLRRRLLDGYLREGADRRTTLGEVTLLATRGMAALEPYFTRYLPALVFAAVLPALTIAALFWLDWLSGLIVLFTIPLVPVFAALIGWATQARSDRQWRALSQLSGHFLDVVRGLPTLVAYRRARVQGQSIRDITGRYRRATMETLKLAFASAAALELIATISVALVAVSVGIRLANGSLDFPTAMVVLLLAPEAYWPLRRVGAEYHAAAEGVSALQQATTLLAAASNQPGRAQEMVPGAQHPRATFPAGDLLFDDVTLTYPDRDEPVVTGLSARLPARGITAVSGPSGAGKSTILAALLGELPLTGGRIGVLPQDAADTAHPLTVNAADPASAEAWRRQFAWAPQRPWLIEDTIRANLLVAAPSATDAALAAALRAVELDEVIATLPEGLDTVLGEDGAGLSAGQRARLGLARVLLADRPWVVLDEPTAHLDPTTEQVIVRVLRALSQSKGVLVVAHRPEIVSAADQVITLPAPVRRPSMAERPAAEAITGVVAGPTGEQARSAHLTEDGDRPPLRGWRQWGTALGTGSVASGVALTATASWLITRAAEQPPILTLMVAIVGVRMFGLARPALRYAERLVSHDAALRLLAERRAEVYDALVPLVPGRLGRRRGDLLTSVVDDVDSLVDQQLRVRQPFVTSVSVGMLATVLVALISWPAALVTGAGLGVALGCWIVVRRASARLESAFVATRGELSAAVSAVARDARSLVVWGAGGWALDGVDRAAVRLGDTARRSVAVQAGAKALLLLAGGVGVLATAATAPDHGSLSPALLALLLLLPIALVDAYLPLPDAATLSVRTGAAAARIDSLAATEPLVSDPVDPLAPPLPPLTQEWHDLAAGWGSAPAFTEVRATLSPGMRLAVVGPSGCGKSTLAAALLRFLDPHAGSITLGGTDLRALALDDVRRLTGLVDDDPHIFSSTLRENLRLARPEADDAALVHTLASARLTDWLARLPHGLDTFLGDGGQAVSGGERARLGMARALLADQPVIVLDEPTAHLDHATAVDVAAEFLGRESHPDETHPDEAHPSPGTARTIIWITHGTVGLDHVDHTLTLP